MAVSGWLTDDRGGDAAAARASLLNPTTPISSGIFRPSMNATRYTANAISSLQAKTPMGEVSVANGRTNASVRWRLTPFRVDASNRGTRPMLCDGRSETLLPRPPEAILRHARDHREAIVGALRQVNAGVVAALPVRRADTRERAARVRSWVEQHHGDSQSLQFGELARGGGDDPDDHARWAAGGDACGPVIAGIGTLQGEHQIEAGRECRFSRPSSHGIGPRIVEAPQHELDEPRVQRRRATPTAARALIPQAFRGGDHARPRLARQIASARKRAGGRGDRNARGFRDVAERGRLVSSRLRHRISFIAQSVYGGKWPIHGVRSAAERGGFAQKTSG